MTETMRPEGVPDALVESGAAAHERWHLDHQTDPDLDIYWSTHRAWVQATLAAVLPEHERMVIDRIACQPPGSVVISDGQYRGGKGHGQFLRRGLSSYVS